MIDSVSLPELGWQPFFQQQLSLEEWEHCTPARVSEQQRTTLTLLSTLGDITLPVGGSMPVMTVGDWVLLKDDSFYRLLDRSSVFSRKSAGHKIAQQLIAVNIDTVFIVSSLNQDFNLNRIERYLALANEAGVEPVIVLTKADCCDEADSYIEQVKTIDPRLVTIAVNALDAEGVDQLRPWCGKGQTGVLLGSSGVG